MLAIMGTYEYGVIKLEEEPEGITFSRVIVTFLDKEKEKEENSDDEKKN
jgi:hypothetical protein